MVKTISYLSQGDEGVNIMNNTDNQNNGDNSTTIFDYSLQQKSMKSNLLKGAKRDKFHIDPKKMCTNLTFSAGGFKDTVLPVINTWNNYYKRMEKFIYDKCEIEVLNLNQDLITKVHMLIPKLFLMLMVTELQPMLIIVLSELRLSERVIMNLCTKCLSHIFLRKLTS